MKLVKPEKLQMAEVKEEIKTEDESLQNGDDRYSNFLSLAYDVVPKSEIKEELYDYYESDNSAHLAYDGVPKNEMKEELYDYYESDDSIQLDGFLIKPEKVAISNVESSKFAESEDKNEQRQEIQGSSASASKTLECAACCSKFSDKAMLSRHVNGQCVESLCRPCRVVLERLDLETKASAVSGFTSQIQRNRHLRRSCRRRRSNKPFKTTLGYEKPLAKKIRAAFQLRPGPESRKRLKCADCSYSTDNRSNFKNHLVTHTVERRFSCTICEYKATQKNNLTQHLLTHGDLKPFACTLCNYRSVHKFTLTKHMRLHKGEKPFKCNQCDYASNRYSTLASHVRAKHTKERPFGCTQCEYTCVTNIHLASHMLTHRADKNRKRFECSDCKYSTNYLYHFKNHLVTHTGERRFPCTMCKYKANRMENLSRHLLTHGDVEPFTCAVCNYCSVDKNNFTRHMRVHTEEKPFKCTQCYFACNQSSNLARHVLSKHTKERPFGCTICKFTCVRSGNLASHMLKHGADKKLSCLHCEYKTNSAWSMKRHVAAKHNG